MPLLAQTWRFPWPEDRIARYTARRATAPIVLDGRLDEADWRAAESSPRFSDLVRGQPGIHDTRAAVLWDDVNLYVGYWVEEPFVEGTFTERDSLIYKNNDVELFIAGGTPTTSSRSMRWARSTRSSSSGSGCTRPAAYAHLPEFDRSRKGVRPFHGVGFKNHPRGPRIGYWNWDLPGLKTAVHVDGTINDNTDRDRGWTVELASRGGRSSLLRCRTGARCRRGTATCGAWISRGSTSTRKRRPRRIPAAGRGARMACGIRTSPELFTRVRFSTEPVGRQ